MLSAVRCRLWPLARRGDFPNSGIYVWFYQVFNVHVYSFLKIIVLVHLIIYCHFIMVDALYIYTYSYLKTKFQSDYSLSKYAIKIEPLSYFSFITGTCAVNRVFEAVSHWWIIFITTQTNLFRALWTQSRHWITSQLLYISNNKKSIMYPTEDITFHRCDLSILCKNNAGMWIAVRVKINEHE